MYGLVNNAIRSMVLEQLGVETWQAIRELAGVEQDGFRAMESYDDSVTYGLVQAASEITGMPSEDLLRAFGRHWILFTGEQGYGNLLDISGSTLSEFLGNLDTMHANITMSFRELQPPSFERELRQDGSIFLRYYSERPGLAPMVEGLVLGLGERFGEKVSIMHVTQRETDGYDGFEIRTVLGEQAQPDAA